MQHLRITHHANIARVSASSWVPALFFLIATLILCSSCSTYKKDVEKSVHHIEQHHDIMHIIDSITTSRSTSLHIEVYDFDPSMAEDMTKKHEHIPPSPVRYMVIDYTDTTTTMSRHDSIGAKTSTTEDNKTMNTRRTRRLFWWVGVLGIVGVVVWVMRLRR